MTLSEWQNFYTNKIQGIQLSTLNDLLSDITWIVNRKSYLYNEQVYVLSDNSEF